MKRPLNEVMRDEMFMRDKILKLLGDEPRTVQEMAHVLNVPAEEAMLWIMALWRYGVIEEQGKPDIDGYQKYAPREE